MPPKRKQLSDRDFHLLLSFLTDSNARTAAMAHDQLRAALKERPALARQIAVAPPDLRRRAEMVMESVWYERVEPAFSRVFAKGSNADLERGSVILASIAYPDVDGGAIGRELDRIATEIDRRMAKEPPLPTRSVHAMRRTLFELEGFRGNEKNYNDPDNSFLNRVLERKLGIPISLSCVYLLVAWRLNLTVHGVGLPGHFIVGHRAPRGVIHIDPFNGGRMLRKKDCEVLVRRLGFQFHEEHLDPVGNDLILARMLLNLINVYTEQGALARAHYLTQLFQSVQR